jgi:hypothetical protein
LKSKQSKDELNRQIVVSSGSQPSSLSLLAFDGIQKMGILAVVKVFGVVWLIWTKQRCIDYGFISVI